MMKHICLSTLAICFLVLSTAQGQETRGRNTDRKIDQQIELAQNAKHTKKNKETILTDNIEQKAHDFHVRSAERAKEKADEEAYHLKVKAREAALQAKSAAQHKKEVAERSEQIADQKVHTYIEKTQEEMLQLKEAAKLNALKAEQKAHELSERAKEAEIRAEEASKHLEEVSKLKIVKSD